MRLLNRFRVVVLLETPEYVNKLNVSQQSSIDMTPRLMVGPIEGQGIGRRQGDQLHQSLEDPMSSCPSQTLKGCQPAHIV
jgi:hypothetical protein